MQLLETNKATYKLSRGGYHRPTPIVLKYIADAILTLIPVVDGIMLGLPEFPAKGWVIFGWSTFGVLFKWVTKFVSEFPKPEITGETN